MGENQTIYAFIRPLKPSTDTEQWHELGQTKALSS